jgi:hypothetical protein
VSDQRGHALVEAQRFAEVAVQYALPITQVLMAERDVESVGMARALDVCGGSAFAEHLLDGISGNKVDEEKDSRDNQPDDGQGVEDSRDDVAKHCLFSSRRHDAWLQRLLAQLQPAVPALVQS